MYLFKDALYLE